MTKLKKYEGTLPEHPHFEIYLNIDHLASGEYELKIVNKNKIITIITFKKNQL
ncbi:hypothetical protein [Dokdonia sp. Hel_I_53]|uniref:hypothetical protein n=1 Tax=Dokdonia sp. Hel_I_53 TaxID=1566287 RepID=UPI00119C43FF|nr:hypothetical protein [Dokdonia sp. Hel_I_53]TVZ52180.1 hypothetical protein OD90_1350 [Dokdonia sp. Hel_I_53]